MKHDIAYYRKIQDAVGASNKKQALVHSTQKQLLNGFKHTINWEDAKVNGQPRELLIMKSTDEKIKKVEAKPNEILRLGSIVEWRSTYWLITKIDVDNQLNYQGVMTQCNTLLKWQLPDGSVHIEYAVTEDATKYGEGVTDNQYMRIGEFALKARVQMNEFTLSIQRDRRFLIGEYKEGQYKPNAYITTRLNHVTSTYSLDGENFGYLEITMLEDMHRSHDRFDLMIADYFEPPTGEETEEGEEWW